MTNLTKFPVRGDIYRDTCRYSLEDSKYFIILENRIVIENTANLTKMQSIVCIWDIDSIIKMNNTLKLKQHFTYISKTCKNGTYI